MTFNLNYHHHLQGHIQGDIRLPANVRDEIAHAERAQPEMENVPDDQVEDHTLGMPMDITLTQPVELQSPTMVEERTLVPQIGGGVHDIHQSEARSSTQPPEQLISLPARPFQREFIPDEGEAEAEAVDDTMDWFQQEEPVRRRPPRQLRSRTIGQVTWDSKFGYRNYDVEEGILLGEFQELLPTESQGSWYGMDTKERWTDQVRQLLYDPKPSPEETTDMRVGQEIPLTEDHYPWLQRINHIRTENPAWGKR